MNYVYVVKYLNEVIYIGRTNNIKRRTYEHNYGLKKRQKKELDIIFETKNKVEAKRYEAYLILQDYFTDKKLKQKVPTIKDM